MDDYKPLDNLIESIKIKPKYKLCDLIFKLVIVVLITIITIIFTIVFLDVKLKVTNLSELLTNSINNQTNILYQIEEEIIDIIHINNYTLQNTEIAIEFAMTNISSLI